VCRRDGAVAYHLASVVDDARSGVTRVVRGRDLAFHTATQVALQRWLELPTPVYRHHFLLLEERRPGRAADPGGLKLAKLHGAVSAATLRAAGWDAARLCGWLACAARLREHPTPARPGELLDGFAWTRVEPSDRVVRWTGAELELLP
jgi:glutamyl-Q tRNA(Asp) synthetase